MFPAARVWLLPAPTCPFGQVRPEALGRQLVLPTRPCRVRAATPERILAPQEPLYRVQPAALWRRSALPVHLCQALVRELTRLFRVQTSAHERRSALPIRPYQALVEELNHPYRVQFPEPVALALTPYPLPAVEPLMSARQ